MNLPPINLSKLINLLKAEGKTELIAANNLPDVSKAGVNALSNPFHPILMEWDRIIVTLEKEIVPLLAKGCETTALAGSARRILASAKSLALTASQVLGFVPGPIGIVCSIINAIVCFSIGNIAGGLCELLGIVPFGKVAGKVSSRLVSKAGDVVNETVQSNRHLKNLLDAGSKSPKAFGKYAPKNALDESGVGYQFGSRMPESRQSPLMQTLLNNRKSLEIEVRGEYWKYTHMNSTYNMPKSFLWE